MTSISKHPIESALFDMDYSERLATGETISSVTSVTSVRLRGLGSITVGATAFTDDTAQVRLSGGDAGDVYRLEFLVLTSSGNSLIGVGQLEIEDAAVEDDAEGTPIADLVDSIRFFAGDNGDKPELSIDAVTRGVRAMVSSGLVPGYSLSADRESVTPQLDDPTAYFILCARTALGFVGARPESMSFATRGFKSSVSGASREQTFNLATMIYKAEHGSMCGGWSSFATWLEGISGVRGAWSHFSRVRLPASSFQTVDVTGPVNPSPLYQGG